MIQWSDPRNILYSGTSGVRSVILVIFDLIGPINADFYVLPSISF